MTKCNDDDDDDEFGFGDISHDTYLQHWWHNHSS